MVRVLVPASRGEELSAFQVCIKPSNLSSHGGVIKAVPTKQNEQSCFPRLGKSVLGSGKILSPALELEPSEMCSAQPCPAQHGSVPLLLCLTGGQTARRSVGSGLHHAGVLCWISPCSSEASGCSRTGEEPFPSTPGSFCFTDLGSAANEHLRLQQEFTKAGRWVTVNTQPWDSPTCVRAALLKALC